MQALHPAVGLQHCRSHRRAILSPSLARPGAFVAHGPALKASAFSPQQHGLLDLPALVLPSASGDHASVVDQRERPAGSSAEESVACSTSGNSGTSLATSRQSAALLGLGVTVLSCGLTLLLPGAGWCSGGGETLSGGALDLFRSFLVSPCFGGG